MCSETCMTSGSLCLPDLHDVACCRVRILSDYTISSEVLCPQKGWTLRSALKQNLFVLKPPGNWSHLNIFERALQRLRGESNAPIDVGTDFFLVLQLGKNE